MPARKRSSSHNLLHDDGQEESSHQQYRRKQSRRERTRQAQEEQDDHEEPEEKVEDDSDGSGSDPEDLTEFVAVYLSDVRKDVQCPICLGIIKKTRTVMECMHRFCRECIDKAMRLGNNECPACRTHCASRRSLRDDPNFDTLIECLYPDIEKYEEEELAFHEEERTRNRQIQESIAQILRRQSEALVKRRTMGKDVADASMARLPRNVRNSSSRRRRNCRILEIQGSDENEDEHAQDGNKASSSTDDCETEIKQMRSRRHTRAWSSQPSSAANSGDGCVENERESSRENRDSPGLLCTPEKLAWGRGGTRSQTRHGSSIGSKGTRSTRLSKLVNYLQGLQEKDDEYVAHKTSLPANDVEMLLLKETQNINPSTSLDDTRPPSQVAGHCKDGLQSLEGQEQVGDLKAIATSSKDHLILAYRQKEAN